MQCSDAGERVKVPDPPRSSRAIVISHAVVLRRTAWNPPQPLAACRLPTRYVAAFHRLRCLRVRMPPHPSDAIAHFCGYRCIPRTLAVVAALGASVSGGGRLAPVCSVHYANLTACGKTFPTETQELGSSRFIGGSRLDAADPAVPSIQIGHWPHAGATGREYATETVRLLADIAREETGAPCPYSPRCAQQAQQAQHSRSQRSRFPSGWMVPRWPRSQLRRIYGCPHVVLYARGCALAQFRPKM